MNLTNMSYIKVNSSRIITVSSLFVLLLALYFAPIGDYLIHSLKYLPGFNSEADTTRNPEQIIKSRGFISETHYLTTIDGYILTLHRIINPYVKNRDKLEPILLQHGFQSSSKGWIITSKGKLHSNGEYIEDNNTGVGNSLAFVLAANGYDVWLANMRGNVYSLNHTIYKTEDNEFWKFSIDEMIEHDFPAIIEHILRTTSKKTIGYIGHSQGTIMMFGLLASKLQYNDIIKPFIALSPVSFLGNATTPFRFFTYFEFLFRSNPTSFLHLGKVQQFYSQLCENSNMYRICYKIYYSMMGFAEKQLDHSRLGPFMATVPSGSSTWSGAHLLQKLSTKKQTKFNFGEEENIRRYGQKVPPEYNLSAINSTNIALIYAANDWLNDINDVDLLKHTLKVPLLDDYLVPDLSWNHMELLWAKDVGKYVNSRILHILNKCK